MKAHHILLAEDDSALMIGVSDLLTMSGYDVTTAMNGQMALDRLKTMRRLPDLIISDVTMPVMDGYDLLEAVRARPEWLRIPFIFLTARSDKKEIRDAKRRGVEDYITKPFDFEDLLVAVEACISRHSALMRMEESRMEVLRRRILTTIHHEFRTPLSYIVAYSDLMTSSNDFDHSDQLRTYVDGIMVGADRLTHLVESFLVLAELESGHGAMTFALRKRPFTAYFDLGCRVIDKLESIAKSSQTTVKLEVADEVPTIISDVSFLEMAVQHLLENAIKFSAGVDEPVVTLRFDGQGGNLAIEIVDKGRGIPEEARRQLFHLFYQVERERYEQQGIGAGLAIVKHVAELHGGRVEVQSEVGQGSRFAIIIPAATSEEITGLQDKP